MALWGGKLKLADGAIFHIGDAPVRLKVNRNARRISLRVDAAPS
jgi:hypothetical protein